MAIFAAHNLHCRSVLVGIEIEDDFWAGLEDAACILLATYLLFICRLECLQRVFSVLHKLLIAIAKDQDAGVIFLNDYGLLR